MRYQIGFALLALPLAAAGCADKPDPSEQTSHSARAQGVSTVAPAGDAPQARQAATTLTKDQVKRLAPKAVQARLAEGALLVCAYDSDEKFAKMALQGATSRSSFEQERASIANDKLLIFYCAWTNESSAASLAAMMHNEHGFKNVAVLAGGPDAWTAADLPLAPSP